jgi:hypothetical protein
MSGSSVNLIIQLVAGAAGGNLAGSLLKQYNLGTLGNSIAGSWAAALAASCSECSWAAGRLAAGWTSAPSSPRWRAAEWAAESC